MRRFLITPNGDPVITHSDEPFPAGTIEIPLTSESEEIPHLQLRVAWAYGAEIEILNKIDKKWQPAPNPLFGEAYVYRIKPSNPNADEIASIREEMLKLEKRLGELS